jgi:hypothetical protein
MCPHSHDAASPFFSSLSPVNKGMCHTVALQFTLKSILMQKEELWKLKYFTMQKT